MATADEVHQLVRQAQATKCDDAWREAHDTEGQPPCNLHEWRMAWFAIGHERETSKTTTKSPKQ